MLIKLDTRLGWLNSSLISFNQLSVGTSKLEFEITENNQPKDLTDLRVMIEIKTPSGSIQEEHVTIIDAVSGKIEKDLSAPMLTEEGSHYGELSLYSQDNTKLLCTHKFRYIVGSNYGEQGAKQTSQYATLQTCIMEVKGLEKEVGNNIEEIEISKNLAEQAKNEAKQSKVESMQSASNSIQSSIAAERSAESALETSGTLDQVVEMAKQSAEASKQSAGASQASADAAERAKDVVLQSVEQSNAASKTANQASVNAEQALRDAIVSKDTAKQAEISATTSANEASKAEASANNSKAILEQKIQEIETVKEAVDSTVATANTALQQANTAIVKAKEISEENKNTTLQATQTAGRAEDAISNANTANQTANQKLIDTTEQANIAKEQVLLAKDEVTKAQAETAKATEQANIATTKSEEATTQADRATREADRAGAQAQEKVNNKIGLNGVHDDTIFNFIKNKVIQDGLVYNKKVQSSNTEAIQINAPSNTIMCNFTPTNTGWLFSMKDSSNSRSLWGVSLSSSGTLKLANPVDGSLIVDTNIPIGLNSPQKLVITQIKDGVVFVTYNDITVKCTSELLIVGSIVHKYNTIISTSEYEIIAYNRSLTPEEIQHNFSVIDNQESIKELHTTDSTGKTSILRLASDTDHVEDRSGRTQDEINRTFYKRMCKEIPSPTGEPITVKNGEEGYVLSAEIKGQSVKSIANVDDRFRTAVGDGTIKVALAISDIGLVKPSSDYTLVTEVISNTLNGDFKLVNINTSNMMMDTNDSVPAGKTGIFIVKLRSKANLSGTSQIIRHALTADSTSGSITYRSCVFEGDLTKVVKGFAPFGLVSTEAIISNNGEEYPIYANEEDRANKKVISLGRVGDVANKLKLNEDGSGIFEKNIESFILDGSIIPTTWFTGEHDTNTIAFCFRNYGGQTGILDQSVITAMCSALPSVLREYLRFNDTEGISSYNTETIVGKILRSKLKTQDMQGVADYFKENVADVQILIGAPIVTHIPKELVPTILTHNQTNILEVGGAVKPSSFKVTLPVDRIAELTARLEAVEAKTNTQPVNTAFVDETYAKSVNKIEEVIK